MTTVEDVWKGTADFANDAPHAKKKKKRSRSGDESKDSSATKKSRTASGAKATKADGPVSERDPNLKTAPPLTEEQLMAKKKASTRRKNKRWNLNTQEDQRGVIKKFIRSICGEGIRIRTEVLNQLNDMADYVCEELISKANVIKTSAGEKQFNGRHVAGAIRNSDIPLMLKPVIFEDIGNAIAKYNSSRVTEEEEDEDEEDDSGEKKKKKKSTEERAGLILKVVLVKKKVAKLVARGGLTGKPQVKMTAAIAIVVAIERVLHRVVCLANNHSTGGLKENFNKVLTKNDVFHGISLDKCSRNAKDPRHPKQYEYGLATYFTNTVFEKCGVLEDIPDRLKTVTAAPSPVKKARAVPVATKGP